MADRFFIEDMQVALEAKTFPSLTLWNRIEGRPRTVNFERALRSEVRDALWMLTRQWQAGELRGEDAGSPVFARVHVATTRLNRVKLGDSSAQDFDDSVPLEAQVESLPIPLAAGNQAISLDLRLVMGRRWLKLIAGIADYAGLFIARYRIAVPDPADRADAAVCAHATVWQTFAATAQRAMDGGALYTYLTGGAGRHAYDNVGVLDAHKAAIDAAAKRFVAWVERLFTQPAGRVNAAWQPDRLEYRFACAAPTSAGEKVLTAGEYYDGRLDWHDFDVATGAASLGTAPPADADPRSAITRTMIPVPLTYAGMPHPRWWTMEDGRTNFGQVRPDTTDLAKLLLIEFALVYSNDWFVVPMTLPGGSIAAVEGLAVTNVFGERIWIEAAGRGPEAARQRWSLFTLSAADTAAPSNASLVVLPTAPKVQEGEPREEVVFIRDEMANMVWAIEKTIPAPDGPGRSGDTSARETRAYHERLIAAAGTASQPVLFENEAAIRYDVMSTVPENWIPFVGVREQGSVRGISLQRAALPRIIEGDPVRPYEIVRPRTTLLRAGLDGPTPRGYLVPEEEVPRAGTRVTECFQRTRWTDGRAFVWLGARKRTGRGEGWSGLAFDRIVPKTNV